MHRFTDQIDGGTPCSVVESGADACSWGLGMEVECTGTGGFIVVCECVGVRESVRRPCAAVPPPIHAPPQNFSTVKSCPGKIGLHLRKISALSQY